MFWGICVKEEVSSSANSQAPDWLFTILWAGVWEQPRPYHACNEVDTSQGLISGSFRGRGEDLIKGGGGGGTPLDQISPPPLEIASLQCIAIIASKLKILYSIQSS